LICTTGDDLAGLCEDRWDHIGADMVCEFAQDGEGIGRGAITEFAGTVRV